MSQLLTELRRKYKSPQAALRALGLSPGLIEGPRLASDEHKDPFKVFFRSLKREIQNER